MPDPPVSDEGLGQIEPAVPAEQAVTSVNPVPEASEGPAHSDREQRDQDQRVRESTVSDPVSDPMVAEIEALDPVTADSLLPHRPSATRTLHEPPVSQQAESAPTMLHATREMTEVVRMVQHAAQQGQRFGAREGEVVTVHMDDSSLGALRLDVAVHRRELAAEIVTTHSAVKALLEAQPDQLYRSLAEQGFRVDRFAVSVGDPGAGSSGPWRFWERESGRDRMTALSSVGGVASVVGPGIGLDRPVTGVLDLYI